MLIDNLRSVVGIVALLCCAWLLSESRRSISWRTVGLGLGLTIVFIVLLLKVPPIRTAFALVHNVVDAVASATRAGTSFVFGYLGGGPLPFELKTPGSEFILAILVGGAGDDSLTGGKGPDLFVFHAGFGDDIITDFKNDDHIQFDDELFASPEAVLAASQPVGDDTFITVGTNTITLLGVSSLQLDDFLIV